MKAKFLFIHFLKFWNFKRLLVDVFTIWWRSGLVNGDRYGGLAAVRANYFKRRKLLEIAADFGTGSREIGAARAKNVHTADTVDMRETYTRVSRDSVARGAAPACDCHLSVCRERSHGVDRACCVSFSWFSSVSFKAASVGNHREQTLMSSPRCVSEDASPRLFAVFTVRRFVRIERSTNSSIVWFPACSDSWLRSRR